MLRCAAPRLVRCSGRQAVGCGVPLSGGPAMLPHCRLAVCDCSAPRSVRSSLVPRCDAPSLSPRGGRPYRGGMTRSDPARVAAPGEGITEHELQLAARNHGMPAEALRYELTPVGLHYLLIHYDIPDLDR